MEFNCLFSSKDIFVLLKIFFERQLESKTFSIKVHNFLFVSWFLRIPLY